MFYRVQAFCDLLDSRKEPFGFSIAPFSSAFSECRIDVFREDMEPPVEISLCASTAGRHNKSDFGEYLS